MRLYRVVRSYATVGGADVEVRRPLPIRHPFQRPPHWTCTGCKTWDDRGNLDEAANAHAGQCRARPA